MDITKRQSTIYLIQEACLFLFISYIVLLGGTFNGLVIPVLNRASTGLLLIIGLIWLIYRIVKKPERNRTGLDGGILLILASGIISTIFSVDPRRSIIGLVILAISILIYYLFVDLIREGLPTQLISKVMILVSGFILFFGIRELLIWYWGWIDIAGFQQLIPPATYRVRAFLGHPNFLAAYLNILIPISLANLFIAKKRITKIILLLYIALALVLVFFTSSRGGWFGTFISFSVFSVGIVISRWEWIKVNVREILKKKFVVILIGITGIAVLSGLFFLLKWQSSHPTHPSGWKNIFASRDYIWVVARDMFNGNLMTGNGLFTFGTEYLKVASIPPNMLLAHAHNLYLNIAGEQGLIGLFSYGVYIVSILLVIGKAYKKHADLSQIEIIGIAAGLFGLGAHSIFETPQSLPVLMILPAVLIAQVTAGIKWEGRSVNVHLKNALLIVVWLISAALMILDNRVVRDYDQGLNMASVGKWDDAAEFLETATEMDPGNALYWFQKGQIYGQLALDDMGSLRDNEALEFAIESYQEGLEIEYDYSVNWMNQGILYRAAGEFDTAIYSMEVAVYQSPNQPAYLLTLGNLYEELSQNSDAEQAYWKALELEPSWVDDLYFQENSLRKGVIEQWEIANDIDKYEFEPLDAVWHYYRKGKINQALDQLQEVSFVNNPEAYWLKGMIYTNLDEYEIAERSYRTALWTGTTNGSLRANIYIGLGEVSVFQGNEQDAYDAYSIAYDLIDGATSYGIGDNGETQYSWYLYYKNSIKQDLLPGMVNLVYSDGMFDGMRFLLKWYCANNQIDQAAIILEKIIFIRPDVSKAASEYFQTCSAQGK